MLGKALTVAGDGADAQEAYATGFEVAERKGDKLAAMDMRVFLKRLQKAG
jgi:hypothetical protein